MKLTKLSNSKMGQVLARLFKKEVLSISDDGKVQLSDEERDVVKKTFGEAFLTKLENAVFDATASNDQVTELFDAAVAAKTASLTTEIAQLKAQNHQLQESVNILVAEPEPAPAAQQIAGAQKTGKRIDHEFDEEVSFTCTLQRNGQTYTKDFSFISLGISYKERLERAEQLVVDFIENNELVEGLKLPTELPNFGGRIRWVAEDPYLIYDFETLHLPKEAKTVRLMAEIVFPQSTSKIVTIPVELNARPAEITDLDYVMTFLETIYSESRDYMFMYDGTLAYLNRDLIVNIEDDLADTLYTYKTRPEVSQSVLDERVYPGYVMPNEDNVLWIVVHDTGLSTVGVNAERLAQNQWNSAYIGAERDASWTYTVDDFGIYQSYEDTVTLWHATDGRSQGGGNLNGIGIEMCVNADGNFEACFLNDARLIGHLLKEYNLGMLNMKQHFDFYIQKNCPQKIRDNDRWFEFLTVCIWEYISQTLLTEYEISYEITADNLTTWPVDGMYDLTNIASGEPVHITYTVNGQTLVIESIKK